MTGLDDLVVIAILTICGVPETGIFYSPSKDLRIIAQVNQGKRYEHAFKAVLANPRLNIKIEDTAGLNCA